MLSLSAYKVYIETRVAPLPQFAYTADTLSYQIVYTDTDTDIVVFCVHHQEVYLQRDSLVLQEI